MRRSKAFEAKRQAEDQAYVESRRAEYSQMTPGELAKTKFDAQLALARIDAIITEFHEALLCPVLDLNRRLNAEAAEIAREWLALEPLEPRRESLLGYLDLEKLGRRVEVVNWGTPQVAYRFPAESGGAA